MKKAILPLIAALLTAGQQVQAATDSPEKSTEMRIGYAIPDNEGLNLGLYIHVIFEGAIQYDANEMERLAGNHITKIRLKVGNELSVQNNFVFITDDLESEPLYKQSVDRFDYGWNDITLNQPFEIDGGQLFIGFHYESSGEVLSLDGEDDNNHANWIRLSQDAEGAAGIWNHQGGGALNIQAIIEGESLPQNDVRIDRHNIQSYAGTREPNPLSLVIRNMGAATVNSIGVTLTVDGEKLPMRIIEGLDIASNDMQVVNIGDLNIDSNNIFDLDIDIEQVNGMADERPDDNFITVSNIISRKDYTARKVLFEHFSTMECANCPSGHAAIDDALRYRDNVIHVIYHAGFKTDALTIPAAETYMQLFTNGQTGTYYAPAAALDRVNMANYGATDGNRSTDCPAFFPRRETLGRLIDTRLSSAALVTIDINHSYDPATRRLTATVSGTVPNGSPSRLNATDPRLTVLVTEDSIEGTQKGVTVPMDGPYIHNRALRAVMSEVWGEPVKFDGANYTSRKFSITVPQQWDDSHLRVVAFLHDYDAASTANWQVFNADEVVVDHLAGISHVISDNRNFNIIIADGRIILPAGARDIHIYTVDGRLADHISAPDESIATGKFTKGIYIITAQTPKGLQHAKIAIP